jgi:carbohydrate diacid regulator
LDGIYAQLVKEINQLIHEDVIFTDEHGMIVASTDLTRINSFHEGSQVSMLKKEKMIMTNNLAKELSGVREGVVLPIMIHGRPFGVLGITGDPEKVGPFATLVRKVAELFIHDTMRQMDEEKQARDLEFFVFDWLHQTGSRKTVEERSKFFGIQMEKYERVILFQLPDPQVHHFSHRVMGSVKRLWDDRGDALFIRWGQERLLVLDQKRPKTVLMNKLQQFLISMKNMHDIELVVGIGQGVTSDQLASSYEQARVALDIASTDKPIIFEEDLRLEMLSLALDDDVKRNFMERTLVPIMEDGHLLDTLGAWLDHDMSVSKAASALHVHKNTVHYRLKQIEKWTGLNLNKTDHLVMLFLGYLFMADRD